MPSKKKSLEDTVRNYSSLGKLERSEKDRSFDDLVRLYFVAFSRAENVLLSEFLLALFNTDDFCNMIEKSALKTTVLYLSLDKLANLKVICPPINKQNEYLSLRLDLLKISYQDYYE